MMNKKIETIKTIDFYDLRNLCIRKNWYTNGSTSEYNNMLQIANKENITAEDIYKTAVDIIEHSNLENYANSCGMNTDDNEFIENVMYEIECITHTFFRIEE